MFCNAKLVSVFENEVIVSKSKLEFKQQYAVVKLMLVVVHPFIRWSRKIEIANIFRLR